MKRLLDPSVPFAKSILWQINRDFYENTGPAAWQEKTVPFHLSSNALVGKTYAALIFACLRHLGRQGKIEETVYLLELGAGQGRLAFHVLVQLQQMRNQSKAPMPPFCYILSDIAEKNLKFFSNHPQFKPFIDKGILDVSYFDAITTDSLILRHSGLELLPGGLGQPLIVLANYFFDSIPNDLFYFTDNRLEEVLVSVTADQETPGMDHPSYLSHLQLHFKRHPADLMHYPEPALNDLLAFYSENLSNAQVFIPVAGYHCIERLKRLSSKGTIMLTLDKGYHELYELEHAPPPEIIRHGSFSIWVNFHALKYLFTGSGTFSLFPPVSEGSAYLACMVDSDDKELGDELAAIYSWWVSEFGPEEFNILKKLSFQHLNQLNLSELLAMLRLSVYDSQYCENILPRIKQLLGGISTIERDSLVACISKVWNLYFDVGEKSNLVFDLAGIFYDLGAYPMALELFHHVSSRFSPNPDAYYNMILCHYQLRQDKLFAQLLEEAKEKFPEYTNFDALDQLDLQAK